MSAYPPACLSSRLQVQTRLAEYARARKCGDGSGGRGRQAPWEAEYVQLRTKIEFADQQQERAAGSVGPSAAAVYGSKGTRRVATTGPAIDALKRRAAAIEAKQLGGRRPALPSGEYAALAAAYFSHEVSGSMARLEELQVEWRTHDQMMQMLSEQPADQKKIRVQAGTIARKMGNEMRNLKLLLVEGRTLLPQGLQGRTTGYEEWEFRSANTRLPWQAGAVDAEGELAPGEASLSRALGRLELHLHRRLRADEEEQLTWREMVDTCG